MAKQKNNLKSSEKKLPLSPKEGARIALDYIHCLKMLKTFPEYITEKIRDAFEKNKNPFKELENIQMILEDIAESIKKYPYREERMSIIRQEAILKDEHLDYESTFNKSLTLLRQYDLYLKLRKSFFENYREMVALEMRGDAKGLEGKMMEFSKEILEVLDNSSNQGKIGRIKPKE